MASVTHRARTHAVACFVLASPVQGWVSGKRHAQNKRVDLKGEDAFFKLKLLAQLTAAVPWTGTQGHLYWHRGVVPRSVLMIVDALEGGYCCEGVLPNALCFISLLTIYTL